MAKKIIPLTDSKIKSAKPKEKPYKLSDGEGLYLYISKTGVKSWRVDYTKPIIKKRATITLGQYPILSLSNARKKNMEIKKLLLEGIDPRQQQINDERKKLLESNNTFSAIADEFINRQDHLHKDTIKNKKRYANNLNDVIGNMPINKIKPIDVLDACRKKEEKGYLELAKKMRSFAGQVFRYGVQTARCERDVTQDLKGALKTPQTKHHSAITNPSEFAYLLRAIDDYQGYFETAIALKLMPILFVRQGELRRALWSDFDLDNALWSFTPTKTIRKTGVELVVPLPSQAMDLLLEIEKHRRSDFVFSAIHTTKKPMSENTLNQALKRLGYTSDEQTVHGFRASARTMIVEQLKYDEKLVEMQLGHRVRDIHGRAYNRVQWLDERREMLQAWADYLDKLKALD